LTLSIIFWFDFTSMIFILISQRIPDFFKNVKSTSLSRNSSRSTNSNTSIKAFDSSRRHSLSKAIYRSFKTRISWGISLKFWFNSVNRIKANCIGQTCQGSYPSWCISNNKIILMKVFFNLTSESIIGNKIKNFTSNFSLCCRAHSYIKTS
jgi:hypothetical protein